LSSRRPKLSPWQKQLLDELGTIATTHPASVKLVTRRPEVSDGTASVVIELPTGDIDRAPGGLLLDDTEQFVIRIEQHPFIFPGPPRGYPAPGSEVSECPPLYYSVQQVEPCRAS
jgi:hypothetical protein